MTLDFTKTATPCQLIAALIPAVTGQLWSRGFRWHVRLEDGTWYTSGKQYGRHLAVIEDAIRALPDEPRWRRFKDRCLIGNAGTYEVLRWLMKARDSGYLPRPRDYPLPDQYGIHGSRRCLCGKDCWLALSEPAVDLQAS